MRAFDLCGLTPKRLVVSLAVQKQYCIKRASWYMVQDEIKTSIAPLMTKPREFPHHSAGKRTPFSLNPAIRSRKPRLCSVNSVRFPPRLRPPHPHTQRRPSDVELLRPLRVCCKVNFRRDRISMAESRSAEAVSFSAQSTMRRCLMIRSEPSLRTISCGKGRISLAQRIKWCVARESRANQ